MIISLSSSCLNAVVPCMRLQGIVATFQTSIWSIVPIDWSWSHQLPVVWFTISAAADIDLSCFAYNSQSLGRDCRQPHACSTCCSSWCINALGKMNMNIYPSPVSTSKLQLSVDICLVARVLCCQHDAQSCSACSTSSGPCIASHISLYYIKADKESWPRPQIPAVLMEHSNTSHKASTELCMYTHNSIFACSQESC